VCLAKEVDAHERLAMIAIEASDRCGGEGHGVIREVVERADSAPLLLELAIALAEERALRGEAPVGPPADNLRTQGES
jgi:hypothetical protein